MISTWHGLETAKRGLSTQQTALHTVSHNIANANTKGYTRQRVNFTTTNPYPGTGINRPGIPGQLGTGVEAGAIERVRESFLDVQYRLENNKLGYYSTLSSALSKMEDIMNEPSDSGLASVMDKFWSALQDLANHTENTGAREVVATTGEMVADTINYYFNSLNRIKSDLGNEINVTIKEINTIITQINDLNKQIAGVEPHGQLPNDLYDKRDLLVDQLSNLVNIRVTNVRPKNYGQASTTASGIYQIELVQADGTSYSPPAHLISVDYVSGRSNTNLVTIVDEHGYSDPIRGEVSHILVGNQRLDHMEFSGKLAGLIESYGYLAPDGSVKGYYPEMMEDLNKLTEAFAKEFNFIHQGGYDLDGNPGEAFFIFDPNKPAETITVNPNILADSSKVAAGRNPGESGDNENAKLLAAIKSKDFNQYEYIKPDENGVINDTLPAGLSGSFDTFYASMIGNMGVKSQSFSKDMANTQVLVDSVEYNRQSVSGVSLDEEMTNMITFQHAYNAAARMITVIDEMLDKIINGMGVVGR